MADIDRDDWDQHWTNYAASATHNPAQRYRRRLIFSLLRIDQARPRVLDIGSGQGDLIGELCARYADAEVLGLEMSRSGIEIAKRKAPGAKFVERDLLEAVDPAPDEKSWATYAVCSEVLEHLDAPDILLKNAAAYLAPGCRFVVTVPGGPMSAYDRHIGHRKHYSPRELRDLIEKCGYEVEVTFGAGFPFFNLYRLVVLLAGQRLIGEAAGNSGAQSTLARVAIAVFRSLFVFNLRSSPWGWQIVAAARIPAAGA